MDDEIDDGYRWEGGYEKTWENLREDKDGSIQTSVSELIHKAKRQHMVERPVDVKLGMMRHLVVVLDMSLPMNNSDLKPTRFKASIAILEKFIIKFFDKNPLSQLGIVGTSNKRAYRYSELSGCVHIHLKKLKEILGTGCGGEPSLQNSLITCTDMLKNLPKHTNREILIIFGSLTSCDPADINCTIKELVSHSITCSMIGLAAEIRICRKLCNDTNGEYNVILDDAHFLTLINFMCEPPIAQKSLVSSMIKMGFPHRKINNRGKHESNTAQCAWLAVTSGQCGYHYCHQEDDRFSSSGYFCPQCQTKFCDLPTDCITCGLTLVAAPHLARSYHHLFPVAIFNEITASQMDPILLVYKHIQALHIECRGCLKVVKDKKYYRCSICNFPFCNDCDVFIHEMLNACPQCTSNRTSHLNKPSKIFLNR